MQTLTNKDVADFGVPFRHVDGNVYVMEKNMQSNCFGCAFFDREPDKINTDDCSAAPDCAPSGVFKLAPNVKVHVCTTCGSPRVYADAFVGLNNENDVRTFDDTHCDDCDGSCKTHEVEVPATFDIETDFYKEKA